MSFFLITKRSKHLPLIVLGQIFAPFRLRESAAAANWPPRRTWEQRQFLQLENLLQILDNLQSYNPQFRHLHYTSHLPVIIATGTRRWHPPLGVSAITPIDIDSYLHNIAKYSTCGLRKDCYTLELWTRDIIAHFEYQRIVWFCRFCRITRDREDISRWKCKGTKSLFTKVCTSSCWSSLG